MTDLSYQLEMEQEMRKVTMEKGPVNTVKFIRHPRAGQLVGKVSVIMFDHEIPIGDDVEDLRSEFQADWRVSVRKYGLDVSLE